MQSLSNSQWYFSQNQIKKSHNLYGNTEDPEQPKQTWESRMELEESTLPDFTLYYRDVLMIRKVNGQNMPHLFWQLHSQTSCVHLRDSRWLWLVLGDLGHSAAKPEHLQKAHYLKRKNNWGFFFFFLTRYRIWGDTNPIIETARPPHGCERYCSSVPSPSFLCQSHIHTAIHTSVTSPLGL